MAAGIPTVPHPYVDQVSLQQLRLLLTAESRSHLGTRLVCNTFKLVSAFSTAISANCWIDIALPTGSHLQLRPSQRACHQHSLQMAQGSNQTTSPHLHGQLLARSKTRPCSMTQQAVVAAPCDLIACCQATPSIKQHLSAAPTTPPLHLDNRLSHAARWRTPLRFLPFQGHPCPMAYRLPLRPAAAVVPLLLLWRLTQADAIPSTLQQASFTALFIHYTSMFASPRVRYIQSSVRLYKSSCLDRQACIIPAVQCADTGRKVDSCYC